MILLFLSATFTIISSLALNKGLSVESAIFLSAAAIHYHSGRCYSKTAHNSDEAELIAILRSIRDECEVAMPELKGL